MDVDSIIYSLRDLAGMRLSWSECWLFSGLCDHNEESHGKGRDDNGRMLG
jgi:hypothetical protein